MTDYKATPEQWETIAEYAKDLNSGPACLLELRSRVEVLEAANRARLIEIIRLTNIVAGQVPDRTKFLTDTTADEDDAKPTPNDRQIRSSLVNRVQAVIGHGSDYDARAAIRVIAGELRAQCFVHAADWLKQETEQ